jgi:DNA repair protein RadA/Sms
VIDSIQTMHSDLIEGAPGTVSQVRASAQELIRFAKERGTALVLVGHVTKDGSIAGPRVLEHMVDTVLSFEGERSHQYRILRAIKNRFGGTDEIGVFAMVSGGADRGRQSVGAVPDAARGGVTGTVVFPRWRGRGRCWSRSRRWSCGWRAGRRRGARWSAGTAGGWR